LCQKAGTTKEGMPIGMFERVKEIIKKKGCHMQILSLVIICGRIAGRPAICKGIKYESFTD
jgi:hypothetical protein